MGKYIDTFGITHLWEKISVVFAMKDELATVATTGSYNDLSDKPETPSGPSDIADYPIECVYGTEPTDWSYVKYKHGKLECWTEVGFGWGSSHGMTKVGNVYKSTYEIGTGLTYPVTFAKMPNVQAFVDPSGNYPGRVEPGGTRATFAKPGGFKVVRDVAGNINGYICINVVGRWK